MTPAWDQEWYSMADAAEILRCGEKAIRRMMQRCELPGTPHGGTHRFHREDLRAFYERCARTGSWPDQRR